MVKKQKPRKNSKANVMARATTPVSVEKLELPGKGVKFMASFSFLLPEGTNNFNDLTDVIDLEMNEARNLILEKVAHHLGVEVNFIN